MKIFRFARWKVLEVQVNQAHLMGSAICIAAPSILVQSLGFCS
jgi:hypothetical protein